MEEIINLPVTRGSNYERVREFYEKLSKNFDALQTLGGGRDAQGFCPVNLTQAPPSETRFGENRRGVGRLEHGKVDRFYPKMAQAQQGRR